MLVALYGLAWGGAVGVRIDARVELMRAIWLGGGYSGAVDALLAEHLRHPAITGADRLRRRTDLACLPPHTDDRWVRARGVERWQGDVDRLADEVDWDAFLAAWPELHAAERAWRRALVRDEVTAWFAATFGEAGAVVVHPSPLLGETLPALVHQVSHGFVGPLVARREPRAAPRVDESITRAVTHLYLRDRHPERVLSDLAANEAQGFPWIGPLTDAIEPFRAGPESPLDLDGAVSAMIEAMTAWTPGDPHTVPPLAEQPQARLQAGLDPAALERLLARAIESRSDALVVWKDGRTVVRWPVEQEPIETMSMTKSIVSLGIGQLVADGKIPSLDTPATAWFPEWSDGEKSAITLRMLLEHTSGLATPLSRDIYAAPDIVALALAQPLETPPGTKWTYNNSAANLVTAIGTRAAGEPFDDYVREHLLEPLGAPDAQWERDPAGNVHGGAGLALTADDLVAIGRMLLDEGSWGDERLLAVDWLRESTGPSAAADWFGQQWWVVFTGEPGARRIVGYRADGWLGQVLVVVPEARLVAVRQMRARPEHWERGDEGVDTFRDFEALVLELLP